MNADDPEPRAETDMILAALLLAVMPQVAPPTLTADSFALPAEPPPPALPALSVAAPGGDPFLPVATFALPGAPRIIRLDTPGSEVVAIRLSVPLQDEPGEAGAGRMLQRFGVERASSRAAAAGMSIEGARTPWGIAYTVVGTRDDFDYMAYVLREAVAEPVVADIAFERTRLEIRSELLRIQETPVARIRADLRARVAPTSPPPDGTPGTVDRLTRGTVRDLWARTHRIENMTLVVAGDVSDELVLSAFQGFRNPGGPLPDRAGGPAAPALDTRGTQVLRHWYGEAFRVADARDPHAAVTAVLAADLLRAGGESFEAEVQLWETESVKAITVIGAAYPAVAARMRTRLPTLLRDTRQSLSPESVNASVSRVRQDLLLRARTPQGLVTVFGRHLDATGDADAARLYLNALDRVTAESTAAFLGVLEGQTPLRVEVRP